MAGTFGRSRAGGRARLWHYGHPPSISGIDMDGPNARHERSADDAGAGTTDSIGFGGGCHWCTEGVFQIVKGVIGVDQGFLQSEAPWDAWAEGVMVSFDPAAIDLATLVAVHLRTHSANGGYSPGGRYRSAVYLLSAGQRDDAARTIARFAAETDAPARTKLLPFVAFRPSEERYRNYYRTDPARPFCRRYIDPKLATIRRDFAAVTLPDPAAGEP